MQKWEYKVATFTLATEAETQEVVLRQWGEQGWELVMVVVVPRQAFSVAKKALLYMKRPME